MEGINFIEWKMLEDKKKKIIDFNDAEVKKSYDFIKKLKTDFSKTLKLFEKKKDNKNISRWVWNGDFPDHPTKELINEPNYNEHLKNFWKAYIIIIEIFKANFGFPYYEGKGPRWEENIKLDIKIPENFSYAVDLVCWEREMKNYFIMVTGHDADSLLCLELFISPYARVSSVIMS